jgi:hypothetical protein
MLATPVMQQFLTGTNPYPRSGKRDNTNKPACLEPIKRFIDSGLGLCYAFTWLESYSRRQNNPLPSYGALKNGVGGI